MDYKDLNGLTRQW